MRTTYITLLIIAFLAVGYYLAQNPALVGRLFGQGGQVPTNQTGTGTQVSVSIIAAPSSAMEGKTFNVGWRVKGPLGSSTNDTRVFYDAVSHPGNFQPGSDTDDSGYRSVTATQSGSVPADFNADVISMPESEKTYFRAYCVVNGIGYWSNEEYVGTEESDEPSVMLISAPSRVSPDSAFTVEWKVGGCSAAEIDYTSVDWGTSPGQYTSGTETQAGICPQKFAISMVAPSSGSKTVYIRFRATVAGVEYFSPESFITVS